MERKASCLSVFLCAATAGRKKMKKMKKSKFFRRAVLVDRKGAEREAVKHLRISMG